VKSVERSAVQVDDLDSALKGLRLPEVGLGESRARRQRQTRHDTILKGDEHDVTSQKWLDAVHEPATDATKGDEVLEVEVLNDEVEKVWVARWAEGDGALGLGWGGGSRTGGSDFSVAGWRDQGLRAPPAGRTGGLLPTGRLLLALTRHDAWLWSALFGTSRLTKVCLMVEAAWGAWV
jgi:hypothetical protein